MADESKVEEGRGNGHIAQGLLKDNDIFYFLFFLTSINGKGVFIMLRNNAPILNKKDENIELKKIYRYSKEKQISTDWKIVLYANQATILAALLPSRL